jgi:methylphosphotriester-DNA--protein-cysteine methyltransferase
MCPSTFCRYFKKRTRKPFTYLLNEIKIGHACKMLIEKDLSITEICFPADIITYHILTGSLSLLKKQPHKSINCNIGREKKN